MISYERLVNISVMINKIHWKQEIIDYNFRIKKNSFKGKFKIR